MRTRAELSASPTGVAEGAGHDTAGFRVWNARPLRPRHILRRVGFHEEYDGKLIDRLIQVMNSDDLGTFGALGDSGIKRTGWYAASVYVSAALGGECSGTRCLTTARMSQATLTGCRWAWIWA